MVDRIEDLRSALAGRYEIEHQIGQGGMAAVYLAGDVRHQRQVAVKVLRPDLAAALGGERFLREIRIAANLTHPHILPLHDSGEADGFLYYVMPYIQGDTLRERIDKEGELPVPEAVRILREVVDALAFAHAQGVIHRDIKPDNIMLSGGHAMVMDFGVAKAVSEATSSSTLTTAGVALGTPAYMAPEQATADPHVDHRADIYAVGVMAYELLAGRTPFQGSPQAVLAAQVTQQADPLSQHRDQVSGDLESLVMKCLAKRAADRWQTAEELLAHLEAMAATSGGLTPTSTRPIHEVTTPRRRVWWMVAGATAAVVVIAVFGATMLRDDPIVITASNITHVTSDPGVEFEPAISPDGSEVAYVIGPITSPRLAVRSTIDVGGGGESRPGEGVGGTQWFPAWTADGASIRFLACQAGFQSECDWKEVGSRGGAVRALVVPRESNRFAGYAWSGDGTRVAFVVRDSIFTYSVDHPEPELLAMKLSDGLGPFSLVWSPDGHRIAFVSGNFGWRISANVGPASIWMVDADGGAPVPVADDGYLNVSPQWLPDGRHLLFVSDRDGPRGIYLVELGSDGPRGPPRSVLGSSDAHSISIAADGRRLAYSKFTVAQNIRSIAIPPSGSVSIHNSIPVTTGNQVIEEHGLSPDGEWIVFGSDIRGGFDVYKQRVAGGPTQLLGTINGHANAPKWSPDGTEIVFVEDPGGLRVVPAGGGTPDQILDSTVNGGLPQWSPDGLTIAFTTVEGPWMVSRDRVGMPWSDPVLLTDAVACRVQDWAPDGSGVLCLGSEIVQLSREGEVLWRYQLSTAGFRRSPRAKFSRDGSRIYFLATHRDGSQGVWWIPVTGGDATKVVAFDDPALSVLPYALSVGPEHLYLTVGEYESDIWAMDLDY